AKQDLLSDWFIVKWTETCHCSKCNTTKPISEFTRARVAGAVKAFCTCNEYQVRAVELQNARKRQLEIEDVNHENNIQEDQENENDLELIELANLSNHIVELLNQSDDDLGNISLFNFQCAIDLSMFDKSTKEVVEELSSSLSSKPRKHKDLAKHRDTPSMEQFDCSGTVKITINQSNNNIATLSLKHKLIHEQPKDITVSQDVKEFIRENIDQLLREIYAQLVGSSLNPLIWQKQIYFWWSELGQNRYKHQDDAFESAIQWFKEGQHKIILEQSQPIRALAIMTELHDYLLKININIHECGIDATYNANNFGMELYCLQAEVNGTEFPLAYLFLENNGRCGSGTSIKNLEIPHSIRYWKLVLDFYLIVLNNQLNFAPRTLGDNLENDGEAFTSASNNPHQIITGREKPEWVKQFKSEWRNLSTRTINEMYITDVDWWICVSSEFFDRIKRNYQPPFLAEHGYDLVETNNIEDDLNENSDELYDELMILTTKALNLLEEQKAVGNSQWVRNIKKNFGPISRMVEEIEQYKRKRTLPLTWKGQTNNTRFLQ
ncbi:43654_t:CDS:2, partial [Gigaspora margarita]